MPAMIIYRDGDSERSRETQEIFGDKRERRQRKSELER